MYYFHCRKSQVFQSAPTNNFLSQVNITVKYSSKTKIRDPVSEFQLQWISSKEIRYVVLICV